MQLYFRSLLCLGRSIYRPACTASHGTDSILSKPLYPRKLCLIDLPSFDGVSQRHFCQSVDEINRDSSRIISGKQSIKHTKTCSSGCYGDTRMEMRQLFSSASLFAIRWWRADQQFWKLPCLKFTFSFIRVIFCRLSCFNSFLRHLLPKTCNMFSPGLSLSRMQPVLACVHPQVAQAITMTW